MVEGQHPISFSATLTGPGRPVHLRDVALICFQVEPYVTSGAHLRPSGAHLRLSGAHLRPSGAHLRPCSRTASPTPSRTASLRLRSRWSRIWCWPVLARDGAGAAQVGLPLPARSGIQPTAPAAARVTIARDGEASSYYGPHHTAKIPQMHRASGGFFDCTVVQFSYWSVVQSCSWSGDQLVPQRQGDRLRPVGNAQLG
jgi:hypothetical protein